MIRSHAQFAIAAAGPAPVRARAARRGFTLHSSRHTPCAVAEPPSRVAGSDQFRGTDDTSKPQRDSVTAHGVCLLRSRRGFTLVELLITISIIGILASMILFAMFQSQETAKAHRTRALIAKLNSIIMRRYDEYKTRRVPIQFNPTELANPKLMARMRMEGLRDLMRMEMPDRWSDVLKPPAAPFNRPAIAPPAAFLAYQSKWAAITGDATIGPFEYDTAPGSISVTKEEHQSAECLYMIVMGCLAQEGDARDTFTAKDVGDVDNDGFPEFVDAWGQPIRFLRWAPGLTSGIQVRGVTNPLSSVAGYTCTVTFDGRQFSTTPGSYVGGVLAVIDSTSKHIDGNRMGQITGYQHTGAGGSAIFTCETTAPNPQPFGGSPPASNEQVAILNPDPFDSRGVYPDYIPPVNPATVTPNFGLVPLIYSAGPDRLYGITQNTSPGMEYSTTARLNPCYVNAGGFLIGEPSDGYFDNISNHQVTTR